MNRFPDSFVEVCLEASIRPEECAELMGSAFWTGREVYAARRYYETDWPRVLRREAGTQMAREDAFAREEMRRQIGPKSFRDLTDEAMAALVPQKLKRLAASYAGDRGVLLVGPTGCGKTLTAVAMARETAFRSLISRRSSVRSTMQAREAHQRLLEMGAFVVIDERQSSPPIEGVCWRSATELSMARRGHPLGQGEAKAIDQAITAKLLVIDDLGWEPKQDTVCTDVLAARYDAGLPTIVTSGETAEALAARYGAAVIRRITETAGVKGVLADLFAGEQAR